MGKVFHGTAGCNQDLVCLNREETAIPLRISKLPVYDGINLKEVESAQPGDIIILAGIEDVEIGDTICTREAPKALPRISVDVPTLSMLFTSNTSPLSGKEGKYVQAGKIRDRLHKESLRNVAIRMEDGEEADSFIVKGRGEFQMAILIETMRREGFELMVGRPQVIYKQKSGKTLEPIEHLFIDCDENFIGAVSEKLSRRNGRMVNLVNHGTGRVRMEFTIPSRSLIGYRNEFLTDTKGTGIMNSYLKGYEEYRRARRAPVFADRNGGSGCACRYGRNRRLARLCPLEPCRHAALHCCRQAAGAGLQRRPPALAPAIRATLLSAHLHAVMLSALLAWEAWK